MVKYLILALILLAGCEGPTAGPQTVEKAKYRIYLPVVGRKFPSWKGVANTYGKCEIVDAVGAAYQYGWSPTPRACPGTENTPMIWGMDDWYDVIMRDGEIGGNSQYLLTFNEPDIGGQSGLSPIKAAFMYYFIQLKFPHFKLMSPAPSHLDVEWLVRFRKAYIEMWGSPPRLDGLAVHCYAEASFCIPTVRKAVNWCNEWEGCQEVWVTEYAWWEGEWRNEVQTFLDWCKSEPTVSRVYWFASYVGGKEWWGKGFKGASLSDRNGTLTPKGEFFKAQ